jgi:hypothetical protein
MIGTSQAVRTISMPFWQKLWHAAECGAKEVFIK